MYLKPIIVEFKESEFDNCLEIEEIELSFIHDNEGHIVHNFEDWSFLKKFKKLKTLKLSDAHITNETSYSFFSNLYRIETLEKLIIAGVSILAIPKKKLQSDLYLKKFKEYEIMFDLKYLPTNKFQPNKTSDFEEYEGIGDIYTIGGTIDFLHKSIPQLYDFPNIEKFKKLETINFYNIFDTEHYQGHLFEMDNSLLYKKINIIKSMLKKSNIKNIHIFGLNLENEKLYEIEMATDDETGKSFKYYDSEIFKFLVEICNEREILFNNENPKIYLQKYYNISDMKNITNLAMTSGIPQGVKNFTLGKEGTIQIKMKV